MPQTQSENEALARINNLLEELQNTRKAFEAWNAEQSPDLPELRQQWLRTKPESGSRSEEILQWQSEDPALLALPAVKKLKHKIAALKLEVQKAEDDLEALEAAGTPRDAWERSLAAAESLIPGIAGGLKKARMEELLQHLYGTSDSNRLPKQVTDAARCHPDVVRLDLFRYDGRRLDPMRDFHTDAELDAAYARIETAIGRLREIITGK
jgi:hypothetical protein